MDINSVLFYVFASIAVLSAGFIAITKKIIYAAFALMATFLSIAAIYIFASADFIAITQIMVYVGGVLILIVFGVMLTSRLSGKAVLSGNSNGFWGWLCGTGIFILLLFVIESIDFLGISWMKDSTSHQVQDTTTQTLGYGLMSNYLLVFEIVAILLLVALIGAVVLAGIKINSPKQHTNDPH